MLRTLFFFLLQSSLVFSMSQETLNVSSSIVQIKAVQKKKDHIVEKHGIGFVIEKKRILTNFHTIEDSQKIFIKSQNDKNYISATLEFAGYDCDLAILKIESESFWQNTKKIEIDSKSFPLRGELSVFGIENGEIKKFSGKIADIRFENYGKTGLDFHKIIETDFTIREGISGSPAFLEGKFCGVAFQTSNLKSRIIHKDVVVHFLNDINDGIYDGFADVGFQFKKSSDQLKNYLGISSQLSGVFITSVSGLSEFEKFLKPKDFIVSLNGVLISDSGLLDSGIEIYEFFEKKNPGDTVKIVFYRKGHKKEITLTLKKNISLNRFRKKESRFVNCQNIEFKIFGNRSFGFESNDFESSLAYHYIYFFQDELTPLQQLDFIFHKYSDRSAISKRYSNKILESVNLSTPTTIGRLEEICSRPEPEFIVMKFRGVEIPLIVKNKFFKAK